MGAAVPAAGTLILAVRTTPEVVSRERRSGFAKALVLSGAADDHYRRAVGSVLEIVPQADELGKLLTKRLTKIINVAAFKNTGNGVSMATKNLGYGAICNTGRLHAPLGFGLAVAVGAHRALR